ncbi:hypothetical protein K443DRAFT_364418 [Laccaria amethystina LaAM-08-1]|uniref:Uncharacterized protein n=1 Tax=Laccaria amethystina LaAM-08-1 TaxID=1095629 RepID=A0A0C9WZ77_9AGAR|nr:hypothetical protein K443DRAFT_364418 [Laccaria amethystina LaAM-08-1]
MLVVVELAMAMGLWMRLREGKGGRSAGGSGEQETGRVGAGGKPETGRRNGEENV